MMTTTTSSSISVNPRASLGPMEPPKFPAPMLLPRARKMTSRWSVSNGWQELHVYLEVGAAHREAALVDERAEHDAPRVGRVGAIGILGDVRAGEVIAGVIARRGVSAREARAVHGAKLGGV